MRGRDVAETDRCDQTVVTSRDHRAELIVEEPIRFAISHQPQIDNRQRLDVERPEVFFDRAAELKRLVVRNYAAARISPRTDLAHEDQLARIRMQCFTYELVHDIRTVELRGINVVDAARDR